MKAIKVEPGKKPVVVDIEDKLDVLHDIVGGYIQAISPYEDRVAVVCDDDGKLKGYKPNRILYNKSGEPYDILCGTFLIVGLTVDSFTDLSDELCEKYLVKYAVPDFTY